MGEVVTMRQERRIEYAGRWWTRRVKLAEEEYVVRSAVSFRLGWLGSYAFGVLSLTPDRVIFTPSPFLGQAPMAWTRWKGTKQEVEAVRPYGRWMRMGWALLVSTDKEQVRLQPYAGKRGWRAQREANDEWSEAINAWMNS
jgi:hypothetical protein